jgi:hypothetical protein
MWPHAARHPNLPEYHPFFMVAHFYCTVELIIPYLSTESIFGQQGKTCLIDNAVKVTYGWMLSESRTLTFRPSFTNGI